LPSIVSQAAPEASGTGVDSANGSGSQCTAVSDADPVGAAAGSGAPRPHAASTTNTAIRTSAL